MPTKIFISASPQSDNEKAWAIGFSKSVAMAARIREDEVYIYLNQRVGKAIPAEVREHIKQARRMICLISNSYLQSSWCAFEHFLFCQKGKAFAEASVGVLQPFVTDWADLTEVNKRERVGWDLKRMRAKSTLTITRELDKHLTGAWTDWLVDTRHVELSMLTAWPTDIGEAVAKVLDEVADPSDPTERLLERWAALCSFALAADRYHDGGWGFSLGSNFDFDEYDGDELPRGRYDVNVIVLHALASFLEQESLSTEWDAIFGSEDGERQPRIQVRDRLPQLAGLLACLTSGGRLGAEIRTVPLETTVGQLDRNLAESRWTLDERQVSLQNFDYGAALLVCLNELQPAIDSMAPAKQRELQSERVSDLLSAARRHAAAIVTQSVGRHHLFSAALRRARAANARSDRDADACSTREDLHVAALWLLLTLSRDASGMLEYELDRTVPAVNRGWTQNAFDELVAEFDRLTDAKDPDATTIAQMFACAAVLAARGVDAPGRLDELQRLVVKVLQRKDKLRLLLRLDNIAWVSLILFTQRTAVKEIDHSLLRDMWMEGRKLRQDRNDAITAASDGGSVRRVIDERIRERIEALLTVWGSSDTTGQNGDGGDIVSVEEMLGQIREATFWGPPLAHTRMAGSQAPDDMFLSGALRVRANSKQVELETPGYNQMFLHPFSAITGMNIGNLRSLRREFGDKDAQLVRLMGETVVAACYERVKGDFMVSARSFEERTEYITDSLGDREWNAAKGFDDLLVVRKGPEGERWVYRTALVQARPGGSLDVYDDRVISWRFVEMPSSVSRLIREGERIERLAQND